MPNSSEKAEIIIDRNNFQEHSALLLELDAVCFPHDEWNEKTWAGLIDYRGLRVYGRSMHCQLAGYLAVAGLKPEAEILRIGVRPEFRNRGLGTDILHRLVLDLAAECYSTVFLEVRRDNRPACSFYRRNGFIKIGEQNDYYRFPTCDALIFQLNINPLIHGNNPDSLRRRKRRA